MTSTEGALRQSVTLVPLLQTGQAGGKGDHYRLCQSTYEEVSANGGVSVSKMLQSEWLLFINKYCHEKVIPVNTLTFCKTKPVGIKVKFLIFSESAPTPIQSSSGNVLYKDVALKPLWLTVPEVCYTQSHTCVTQNPRQSSYTVPGVHNRESQKFVKQSATNFELGWPLKPVRTSLPSKLNWLENCIAFKLTAQLHKLPPSLSVSLCSY